MKNKFHSIIINIFFILVCLALTAPLWVFKDLLFPYVTSKAFFFRIAVELALPFYLYLILSEKKFRPNLKNPLSLAMLGFVLVNWISAFFGVNINRSLWGNFERMGGAYYITHLALLYFYILLLGQYSGRYIKLVLQCFLLVAAIIALNGVSGWLGGPTLTLDPSLPGRASSTLGNPIYLGAFAILPIFLSGFFALQAQKIWAKIAYAILALIFLLAGFQSGTRGALVGLLAGLSAGFVAFAVFQPKQKIKIISFALLGALGLAAGLMFKNADKLPPGSTVRRIFQLKDSNTSARFIQWQSALKGFKEYPIFGTGPENYYIVANKYYNPELYQYDRSWFDKPHNYLLEILVTNGIAGLIFYAGILASSVWIIMLSFKKGFLTLLESCFLLAGFLAYQFQNLFVFDTVPTSVAFYSLLGFLGYLVWEINYQKPAVQKNEKYHNQNFVRAIFGATAVLAVYLFYATNWLPARVSKNVNYGYAYAGVDVKKAMEYFDTALSLPFNFDFSETGSKFTDFAAGLVAGVDRTDPAKVNFAKNIITKALEYQVEVAKKASNDPVVLQKLANAYLYAGFLENRPVPFEAVEALQKAISLAPNRVEARIALANLRLIQGFPKEAAAVLEEAARLDAKYGQTRWQSALVYRQAGDNKKAVEAAEKALELGFRLGNVAESQWLLDIYRTQKDFAKAVKIYETAAAANQLKIDDYVALVELYVKAGAQDKARELAGKVISLDKGRKEMLEKILKANP